MTLSDTTVHPSPARSRWLPYVLLFGALSIAGAVFATIRVREFADPGNYDPAPLPRKGINAPYIKTADRIVDKMIDMAQITDKDLVYDLGCGDGRLVISSAVQRGSRGVGFDIEPARVTEATANAKQQNVASLVTIKEQDVFTVDLREADVIVMYLLPWMLEKLKPQFDQCRPGTRIVSHDFSLDDVEKTKTEVVSLNANDNHYVHLYVTPLKHLPPSQSWKRKK